MKRSAERQGWLLSLDGNSITYYEVLQQNTFSYNATMTFLITRPTLMCNPALLLQPIIPLYFIHPVLTNFDQPIPEADWSLETHYHEALLLDWRPAVLFRKKVKLVNKVFPSRGQHGLKNEQHAWKTSMIQDVVHFTRASAFKFQTLNTNSCGWQLEFWWLDVISQKRQKNNVSLNLFIIRSLHPHRQIHFSNNLFILQLSQA